MGVPEQRGGPRQQFRQQGVRPRAVHEVAQGIEGGGAHEGGGGVQGKVLRDRLQEGGGGGGGNGVPEPVQNAVEEEIIGRRVLRWTIRKQTWVGRSAEKGCGANGWMSLRISA